MCIPSSMLQRRRHPRGALLGEHELHVGKRSNTPPMHQLPQRAVGEPRGLDHPHELSRRVLAVVGVAAARVVVDDQAELLARLPQRVVDPSRAARVGRRRGRPGAGCRREPGSPAHAPRRPRASTSLRKIWAMPARRPGARRRSRPASGCGRAARPTRRSRSSGVAGGWAMSRPVGKNGGTVFGKITSATRPSASSSAKRRSLSQLRVRPSPCRSWNGL